MVPDEGDSLHRQNSGFKRIAGVEGTFDFFPAGLSVSHRVALQIVHGCATESLQASTCTEH